MKRMVAFVLFTAGCNMPSPVCPTGEVLKPPAFAACSAAFLAAAQNITSCAIAPSAPACVDDVIAAGGDLTACLPTCGVAGALKVNKAVLRANIMESLKATGH